MKTKKWTIPPAVWSVCGLRSRCEGEVDVVIRCEHPTTWFIFVARCRTVPQAHHDSITAKSKVPWRVLRNYAVPRTTRHAIRYLWLFIISHLSQATSRKPSLARSSGRQTRTHQREQNPTDGGSKGASKSSSRTYRRHISSLRIVSKVAHETNERGNESEPRPFPTRRLGSLCHG